MAELDRQILENAYKIAKSQGIKTWTEFAEKAGTTPQTLNNIKSDDRGLGVRLRKKLAKALKVNEIDLYPKQGEIDSGWEEEREGMQLKLISALEELNTVRKENERLKDRVRELENKGESSKQASNVVGA